MGKPLRQTALVVVALVLVGAVWFALQVEPIFSSKGPETIITVRSGESFAQVAATLHEKGVIASPFAFRLENLVLGTPLLRPGEYGFQQRSSFASVRAILSGPPNVVIATPGLTLHEIALDVAGIRGPSYGDQFVKAATSATTPSPFGDGPSLEGLIGAGTYVIAPSMTPSELAAEMVGGFDVEATSLGLTPKTKVNGLDAYQLITAASIVEKEGYYPRNMPDVARVIFNRLARGGPLQMDSTVLYYLGRDGGTVTPAMLQTKTPYNTYLNVGLTPTPICTVSKAALRAVLHAPAGTVALLRRHQ